MLNYEDPEWTTDEFRWTKEDELIKQQQDPRHNQPAFKGLR